jgi:hypothetical protein
MAGGIVGTQKIYFVLEDQLRGVTGPLFPKESGSVGLQEQ